MKIQFGIGVVFDCNVLLQAAARKTSPAAACLRLAEEGLVHLYLSEEVLTELSEVLSRPKVRARFPDLTDEIVEEFLERLKSSAEVIRRVSRKFTYHRDVDDEPYVNLAVETKADYLVSRDNDLLDLMTGYNDECKEFRRRFRPLKVIDPVAFLKEMEKAEE